MTVSVQVPYTSTDANGVTTSFPFNFKCFDEEDLTITLDGVVQTTGFTVYGIGDETGGSIIFAVAPANGVTVLVANNTIPKRETNYPQYGAFPADIVNKDFDRIWIAIQYLLQKIRTAIKLPFDTGVEAILTQDAAGRALKYLGFDAGGGLTLEDIPDLATTQAAQAAAEAAAATISGFENVGAWATGTYYTKNNLVRDGGSTYVVIADPGYTSGASAATDIGNGDITVFAQKGDAPPGGGDVLVANNLSEFTATKSTAQTNLGFSAFAKTLIDDADAATARATLGAVASVTGTAPVVSSGGLSPAISMAAATASVNGYMTSTYATKLDGIEAGANVGVSVDVGALGLGMFAIMKNNSGGPIGSGATVAGSSLLIVEFNSAGTLIPTATAATGTWTNVSGTGCASGETSTFQRTV